MLPLRARNVSPQFCPVSSHNSERLSIDGIALSDFDYIDIGALIQSSGAVPVVIKSLIFPASPQQ